LRPALIWKYRKMTRLILVCLLVAVQAHAQPPDHGDRDKAEDASVAHAEHGEDRSVHISKAELDEFGIGLTRAQAGVIGPTLDLAGEVVVNPDRFAHVVPRVGGVVRQVRVGLGDNVRSGEVMATIDSRELSDLKSAYLAAVERLALSKTSFEREEGLWKQNISSEREFLAAQQAFAEARIEARSAKHQLRALGFSEAHLDTLPGLSGVSFTRFEIRAPLDGVVVSKHITLGESVGEDTEVFSVADLDQVWAILTVYQRDLKWIREGMHVAIVDREVGDRRADGRISYVSPVIDETTRTASARVVLENADGMWRPGMFVRGKVATKGRSVRVAIPRASVQSVDGEAVVFVYDGDEFHLREVRTGRSADELVEIEAGLEPGETIVSKGAFTVKTQIEKGEFEAGHSH
jgi:membrane fusion protein, heavy metal efflux system